MEMPILGYGVYQVSKEECERCVLDALRAGYRSIDTAQAYFNEEEVGTALIKSGIPRKDIFLTSKVWVEHYGYEECRKSVEASLRKLQTDYLDLMLLHQPFADYYGAWRALEELYEESCVRSGFPISILTGWWIWPPLPASARWSIRWKHIRITSRFSPKSIWINTAYR